MLYAVNKKVTGKNITNEQTLENLVKNEVNKLEIYLSGAMQANFYIFLNKLLYSPEGRSFIILLQNKLSFWHKLPKTIRVYLPLLAQSYTSNEKYLKEQEKTLESDTFLKFASQNSFFLYCYIKACLALKKEKRAAKAYAKLLIKFPKTDYLKEINLPKSLKTLIEKEKSQELHLYTKELLREFSESNSLVPKMNGTLPFLKDKKETLPNLKEKKQIYIYFAPWCAHCLHLLKSLGEKMNKSFWEKTQLIAVFSEDKEMLKDFIKRTELEKKNPEAVKNLLMIGEGKEAEKLYHEKLYLYAVPKVIVTNKKGKIINFSFPELEPSEEQDSQRDLDLILSHFK